MTGKQKIIVVAGTRPEVIKLFPVYKELKSNSSFDVLWIATGQHKEMLNGLYDFFDLKPDYSFDAMKDAANLGGLAASLLKYCSGLFEDLKPECVIVQGDTTTAMAAALSAFYFKIRIAHVEAGLRSYNNFSPFPEEVNRRIISGMANFHYAPTKRASENLYNEKTSGDVLVTGNTVIDALLYTAKVIEQKELSSEFSELKKLITFSGKIILVTSHRRENIGNGINNICQSLLEIAKNNPSILIIFPIHFNPAIKLVVEETLGSEKNIKLIKPLPYNGMVLVMKRAYIILTDSGGIQEEAPTFQKPMLVLRDTTERPEGIEAGCAKLIGTNPQIIINEVERLLIDDKYYSSFSQNPNPYGDGKSAIRIVKHLSGKLLK